jgi:serine/threonine protein kinase
VLYELLTLQPPFPGPDPPEVLRRICHESAERIEKLNRKVPRALARICRKAIEKDPSERYASAADLEADLVRYLGGRRVVARRLTARRWVAERIRDYPRITAAALLFTVATGITLTQYPTTLKAAGPDKVPASVFIDDLSGEHPVPYSEEGELELMGIKRDALIQAVDLSGREKKKRENAKPEAPK